MVGWIVGQSHCNRVKAFLTIGKDPTIAIKAELSSQNFQSGAPTSDCICNIKGSARDKHPPTEIELLLGGGSSPPTTSIHVSLQKTPLQLYYGLKGFQIYLHVFIQHSAGPLKTLMPTLFFEGVN